LRSEELRGGTTAARKTWTGTRIRTFPKRANDTLVKCLNAVLLLITNFWLRLDNVPELKDVILNLLNIDAAGDIVTARHFLDIGF